MLPIHLNKKGVELPEEGEYYVVAKNGNFIHQDTGVVSAFVKTEKPVPMLEELKARARFKLPKIPVEIFYQTLFFFRRVWDEHASEAAVVIYFDRETQEYALYCPKQDVSSGGVYYDVDSDPLKDPEEFALIRAFRKDDNNWGDMKGMLRVGTIHSHCNFSAYHSGVDTHDESTFDGVHITIGHVDRKVFSVASSLVTNNNRFKIDPRHAVNGIGKQDQSTVGKIVSVFYTTTDYYLFTISEEEQQALEEQIAEQVGNEWMPRVKKKVYTWKGGAHDVYQWWKDKDKKDPSTAYSPAEQHDPDDYLYGVGGYYRSEDAEEVPPPESPKKNRKYLHKVKKSAQTLKQHGNKLSTSKLERLVNVLRRFFGKNEINDSDVDLACRINPYHFVQETPQDEDSNDAEEKTES